MRLEKLKCLDNEVAQVLTFALRIIDLVALVQVFCLEKIHDWQDLTVIGHESLTDGVAAEHEALQDVKGDRDHVWVARVQCR